MNNRLNAVQKFFGSVFSFMCSVFWKRNKKKVFMFLSFLQDPKRTINEI